MHLSALGAIQGAGEFKAYYQRQVGKGKMSVINAVRNKLLLRVCACIGDNQLYDPDYVYKAA